MADKFRTQDGPLLGVVSYVVRFPGNLWFAAEVMDLLHDMTDPENWVQDGTVTVDEAAQASTNMYLGFGPMIGQLIPFVTAALPENCLLCDGSTYLRVDYPSLYGVLDSAYIVDTDHFVTPNLIDNFIVGAGSTYAPGAIGGEATHTLTIAEMPNHTHTYTGPLPVGTAVPPPLDASLPNPFPSSTGGTGGDGAHNNLPPYIAVQWGVVAQ